MFINYELSSGLEYIYCKVFLYKCCLNILFLFNNVD